jgi:hypothetical protein
VRRFTAFINNLPFAGKLLIRIILFRSFLNSKIPDSYYRPMSVALLFGLALIHALLAIGSIYLMKSAIIYVPTKIISLFSVGMPDLPTGIVFFFLLYVIGNACVTFAQAYLGLRILRLNSKFWTRSCYTSRSKIEAAGMLAFTCWAHALFCTFFIASLLR